MSSKRGMVPLRLAFTSGWNGDSTLFFARGNNRSPVKLHLALANTDEAPQLVAQAREVTHASAADDLSAAREEQRYGGINLDVPASVHTEAVLSKLVLAHLQPDVGFSFSGLHTHTIDTFVILAQEHDATSGSLEMIEALTANR